MALEGFPLVRMLLVMVLPLLDIAGAAHPCDHIQGEYGEWYDSPIEKEVVVVGGGVAGLAAMRTLRSRGVQNILLLEAQDYLGGRVKTFKDGNTLVEDGAEWINGGSKNPLYKLAKKLKALTQPLRDTAYEYRVLTSKGGRVKFKRGVAVSKRMTYLCDDKGVSQIYTNEGYGQCYMDRFSRFYDRNNGPRDEKNAWFNYLKMEVSKDLGTTNWMSRSAGDEAHFTDWNKDKWNQWKKGYNTLTKHIHKNIPDQMIKMSSPVCKVFWDDDPKVLLVTADEKVYLASHVIMTASVGHLKERHRRLFSPQLDENYAKLLDGMELGIADKVQIGWAKKWWRRKKWLNIHIIFKERDLSAEESWMYGIIEFLSIHQQEGKLQVFVPGKYAKKMESLPEETVKQHLLKLLRRVSGQNVPEPNFFRRTKWLENFWTRGSYNSYVKTESFETLLPSRRNLTRSIVNYQNKKVIFWAGEHTSTKRFGTVDGAMASGRKAAIKVKDEIDCWNGLV